MADGIHRLLNSLELARLARLFLNSRFTVEGQLQGAHKSPLKGFSVEFADYRQYVPGDDLRHLDWRVYGRSERLYLRQYEEECNLRAYLLVDGSYSMSYNHEGISKYDYAAKLAASLAYIITQQQDSVGVTVFDTEQQFSLGARSGSAHLRQFANLLADHEPKGETDLTRNVSLLTEKVQRRALIVIISDLLDAKVLAEPGALRGILGQFKKRKHDVIVYHVLDRAELELPFRDLGHFEELETGEKVITNPAAVRHAYQEAIGHWLHQVKAVCRSVDVDYTLLTTDQPIGEFVRRHLNLRQGRR